MSKRSREGKKVVQDPAISKVYDELEASLTFFLGNIGSICSAYSEQLQRAMPNNPKATRFFDNVGGAEVPGSPLQQASPNYPAGKEPESPLLKRNPSTAGSPVAPMAPATLPSASKQPSATAIGEPKPAPGNNEAVLLTQLQILRSEARSLFILFKQINAWLSLSLRPFEEEDTDHNQACQVILGNLPGMMETTKAIYDVESKYLESKFDLEVRQLRHPDCESINVAFKVLDGTTWDEIEKGWRMMIRSCLLLHALISKNMKSLKDPRGGKLTLELGA